MKLFGRGVLLVAVVCFLNACASKNEVVTESGSQNRAPVAGENVSGSQVTPGAGPGGASANVRW